MDASDQGRPRSRSRSAAGGGTPTSKRWITEPIVTGILGLMLFAAWQFALSMQFALSTGGPSPLESGMGFVLALLFSVLWISAPVIAWVLLAILGNRIVRKGGFGARILMAWCAAVVLALPFVIYFAIVLSQGDGWGSVGALSVGIPVAASILVLPAYATAHVLLNAVETAQTRRQAGTGAPSLDTPNGNDAL